MQIIAGEQVVGIESRQGAAQLAFLSQQTLKARLLSAQAAQKACNQGRNRGVAFGGDDARPAIHLILDRDRDIFHIYTVSQFHLAGKRHSVPRSGRAWARPRARSSAARSAA